MTNLFLKVNKDLFNIGLSPIEILLVSQVAEFQTNTGICFISDKTLAENFGVSESTITRTLKGLENKGIICRTTKNVKGGKERHMTVNYKKIAELSTSKMTVDGSAQPSKCLLSTSKMTVDNKQNDLIKDNLQDNSKDNINEIIQPSAEIISLGTAPGGSSPIADGKTKPYSELTETEKMDKFKQEFGF